MTNKIQAKANRKFINDIMAEGERKNVNAHSGYVIPLCTQSGWTYLLFTMTHSTIPLVNNRSMQILIKFMNFQPVMIKKYTFL